MQIFLFRISLLIAIFGFSNALQAQGQPRLSFFEHADSLHKTRFWVSAAGGATLYTATIIGLNEVWYADYPRSDFHFFDDMGEWNNMDKFGHTFTAYFESLWSYNTARWTGMKRRKAMWLGVGMGTLFQASIEVLDGFSEQWGFSIPDIAFNTLGVSTFAAQELLWQEQRISLKVSSSFSQSYPDELVFSSNSDQTDLLSRRADELYGGSYPATFLKDYNAMTIWASINLHAFMPDSKLPGWLNIAVGHGAQNLYGGFENSWEWQGAKYRLANDHYPRYRQFYLSPDIDLTRIRTRSRFVKTLFSVLNLFKIPAPALEINTLGKVKFHALHF